MPIKEFIVDGEVVFVPSMVYAPNRYPTREDEGPWKVHHTQRKKLRRHNKKK